MRITIPVRETRTIAVESLSKTRETAPWDRSIPAIVLLHCTPWFVSHELKVGEASISL